MNQRKEEPLKDSMNQNRGEETEKPLEKLRPDPDFCPFCGGPHHERKVEKNEN